MKNILVVGVTGSIGRKVCQLIRQNSNVRLTTIARRNSQTHNYNETNLSLDASHDDLNQIVKNQDAVFICVSGDVAGITQSVVKSMQKQGIKRVVLVTAMGIYNEIPKAIGSGNLENNAFIQTYRDAADCVENSELDYTILRPGWFDDGTLACELTPKGTLFGGHDISRDALAQFCYELLINGSYLKQNLGINRPIE